MPHAFPGCGADNRFATQEFDMRNARGWMALLTAAGLGLASAASAKATADEAAQLGKSLTPVGAVRAANSLVDQVAGRYDMRDVLGFR